MIFLREALGPKNSDKDKAMPILIEYFLENGQTGEKTINPNPFCHP